MDYFRGGKMISENILDKSKLIAELKEIHNELVEVYKSIFEYKYSSNEGFKNFIDRQYRENGISKREQQAWNDNFCHRASYTILNKILFIRICEDKDFMLNPEDYIAGVPKDPHIGEKLSRKGLQKWANLVTNYTLGELVKLAFLDMKKSYANIILYKDDKYDILNPTIEELSLKYIEGDEKTQKLILQFENILDSIVEKLDTNKFNFKYADGSILGDVYEKFMDRDTRKAIGQFYTPEFVIEFILKNTVAKADVVENPFVTVADISCGSGHFLIMAYDILRNKFIKNLEILRDKYANEIYAIKRHGRVEKVNGKDYWKEENIHYHLLKHCIYGADIDSFAVQLTTINLLLKDLDNFTDELNTIECDSLIKWEEDYEWQDLKKQLQDISMMYTVKYRDLHGIERVEDVGRQKAEEMVRLCEFWNKKYDYVVGNPPYVRQEKIKNKQYLEKKYQVYHSMADLLTYFIERGLQKIKQNGLLGMIISDKFTRTNYGKNIREFILKNYCLTHYKDKFEDEKVIFEDATVDSTIIVIKNKQDNINNKFLYNDIVSKQSDLDGKGWYFTDTMGIRIRKKMDNIGIRIKNIKDIKINRGILTGFNDAYIIDIDTKKKICEKDPNSEKIIKKLLRGRDVDKYSVNWNQLYLINTGFNIDIEAEFPAVYEHLYNFRDKLVSRSDQGIKWYNLRACTYYEEFEKEKIIYANMAIKNRFYYDDQKFYTNQKAFILTSDKGRNLKYLSGLLNSNLLFAYFRWITPKLQGETREYSKIFVNEVPLVLTSKYEAEITELVDGLLTPKKKFTGFNINDYCEYLREQTKQRIDKQKAMIRIDQMVYDIYQMTPEEIQYIENETNEVITKEKEKYLEDLIKGNCPIIFDYLSNYGEQFVDELESLLSLDEFIYEHVENNKGLEDIARQFNYEYSTVALLRERYAEKFKGNERWKIYNISEFYRTVSEYCIRYIIEILQDKKMCLSYVEIRDHFREKCNKFEEIMTVLQNMNSNKNSLEIIKEIVNKEGITWNRYIKERIKNKVSSKIIKYETNKKFGLSEWSDEIHKNYFLDAIEEYTVNNPNEKKARDILKLFKDLDIEDKKDYIEVIQEKIKTAFARG